MHVLIVDDHHFFCAGFSQNLVEFAYTNLQKTIEVSTASSIISAIQIVKSDSKPDLIFLDLNLGDDCQGLTTVHKLQSENIGDIPIVIFTGLSLNDDSIDVFRECMANPSIRGILTKSADLDVTFKGLARLLDGEIWIPGEVMRAFAAQRHSSTSNSLSDIKLTLAEQKIANGIAQGLPGKVIARNLNISHAYVRQVSSSIYRKLGVHSAREAGILLDRELRRATETLKPHS